MCNRKKYSSYSLPVNTIDKLERIKIKLESKRMETITKEQLITEAMELLIKKEELTC